MEEFTYTAGEGNGLKVGRETRIATLYELGWILPYTSWQERLVKRIISLKIRVAKK